MRIAIPLAEGRLSMHFGYCEQFALVEVDDAKQIVDTQLLTPPGHQPGVLPDWLRQQGADVVIVGGMGVRAQQLFAESGIEVVLGAPPEQPEALASAYLAGTLETGENVCDH